MVNEALMMDMREGRIVGGHSFITLTGILSIPGTLFVAFELIINGFYLFALYRIKGKLF